MAAFRKYNLRSTKKLFDSICNGEDEGTTQDLLQICSSIDARDSQGYTPLLLACLHSRMKTIDLLIKFGANVDVKCNSNGYTVLHYASKNGWINTLQTLVKKVLDLDATDDRGDTALHHALRSGFPKIVKYLVEEGADIHKRNNAGNTALHYASAIGKLEIVKYLLKKGANVTTKNNKGGTALYGASGVGYLKVVECLVEKGSDIDTMSNYGTALHNASHLGHLEVVKFLVEKGANVNLKDLKGATPVLRAAQYNHKDIVDLLMHSGAKFDGITSVHKFTILHIAAVHNWIDVVQSIVNRNCYLDAKDVFGRTALGLACKLRKWDIAQCLLQAKASWDIEDKDGNSPLNYVTRGREPELKLIKLFIENGAYLKRVDYEAILKSSSQSVLQDVELCCQSIANKFNNFELPELYKLPASGNLPRIEKMKIVRDSEVARAIKRSVVFDIQSKKHCNILEVRPMVLGVFSVRSVLEYSEKKTSELQNSLKRPAAFDPSDKCQPSSKVMRLS